MTKNDEAPGLQFPCQFPLKVMGKNVDALRESIEHIVNQHVAAEHLVSITERSSKGARFVSITITIDAQRRAQLDDLYRAFNRHSDVIMVL